MDTCTECGAAGPWRVRGEQWCDEHKPGVWDPFKDEDMARGKMNDEQTATEKRATAEKPNKPSRPKKEAAAPVQVVEAAPVQAVEAEPTVQVEPVDDSSVRGELARVRADRDRLDAEWTRTHEQMREAQAERDAARGELAQVEQHRELMLAEMSALREALQSCAEAATGSRLGAPNADTAEQIIRSGIRDLRERAEFAEGHVRVIARVALGREPTEALGLVVFDIGQAIRRLRDGLAPLEVERDQLQARVSELEGELNAARQGSTFLAGEMAEARRERDAAEARVVELEALRDHLQAQTSPDPDLARAIERARVDLEAVQGELTQATQERDIARMDRDLALSRVSELEQELNTARLAASQLALGHLPIAEAIAELNRIGLKAMDDRDAARAQLSEVRDELAAAYDLRDAAEKERIAARAELSGARAELSGARAELSGARDLALSRLAEAVADLESARDEAHGLRAGLLEAKRERERDAARLSELRDLYDQRGQAMDRLRDQRDAAMRQLADGAAFLGAEFSLDLRTAVRSLITRVRTLDAMAQDRLARIEELEREVDALRAKPDEADYLDESDPA